ncbi:MAG: sigma-70 family RNA polymerase sigma factor [Phycisphaerales bacterium]|nr:sigma-70 family RNA polymerase sigma factor [Phycisphaerales bacterium]
MEWLTTTTILENLRDYENRGAWDRFAARFRRPIVRFAKGMGLSQFDADDVAQETLIAFAEAFRKGQYHPDKGRLSRWLFGIAYRQALTARRGDARRAARLVQPSDSTNFLDALADETATGMWDAEWEQALLNECLDQIRREVDAITFRAFELTVQEDIPPGDAAETLGVPIKTVYNAKHRILKRIRELRAEFETVV